MTALPSLSSFPYTIDSHSANPTAACLVREYDAELISDNSPAADAVVIKRQSFLFLIEGITALAAQT